jgi:hypothetical protein
MPDVRVRQQSHVRSCQHGRSLTSAQPTPLHAATDSRLRGHSRCETSAHQFQRLSCGWHYTDHDERSAIDDDIAIDQDLVLAIMPANHLHLDSEIPPNACRHTGGVQSRDSERTVLYRDSRVSGIFGCHLTSLRSPCQTRLPISEGLTVRGAGLIPLRLARQVYDERRATFLRGLDFDPSAVGMHHALGDV